ncbi:glutamyl-tRNA reductase [Halobacillus andaensis]|uniref:Glutamyl-tRNA reductase n=1 Tax=Halobacillus andaensis TaxID=1176239 RepID=A0A917AZ43_HALAA|nr:glutamyl-tRNA reductase [Halobacillus andaensis]MBP2002933.1 glutamyl-tRNA reductase [Halobacillus andaensis]GGF06696.1 glutamyl-tRNA reductase [Halobacillus andaensis]
MHILTIGLNFKTAPVEIREKLTFSEEQLPEAMKDLNRQKSVLENVIISTCNRTEIYAVVDQLHTGRYYIKQFLADWFDIDKEDFSPFLTIYEADGAMEHLFRVTSGLDSMVLGETQILGQIKQVFHKAQQVNTSGTIFNQLFKQAITMAKKGHKDTGIGENAVSVSYAAVELARKIFGDLVHKHIVIIGAGKMGELAAKNLHGSGVKKVTVMNRTLSKAQVVAKQFNGQATTMEDLNHVLRDADIVISSTGASDYVLTKEQMEPIHKSRKGKPLFFVDIAVPRDLDPAMENLDSVFLYDIDDLQGIVDANLAVRKQAAEEIGLMIEAEIVQFKEWLQTIGVVPVISALRAKALNIQSETMESIERKMPDLTEREKKVLRKHTKSIINQMLKEPILQAKELSAKPEAEESLRLFTQIFGIEEEVEKELQEQEKKNENIAKSNEEGTFSIPTLSKIVNS